MQKQNNDTKTSTLGPEWRRELEADAAGQKAEWKGAFDSTGAEIHSQEFAATSESGGGGGAEFH